MSFDTGGVVGLIILVPLLAWALWWGLRPYVFRWAQLPALARRHGWAIKTPLVYWREAADLPGDGRPSWEHSLPNTSCELLGTYRGRPVHGVEVTHRRWQRLQLHTPWNAKLRRFCVVAVATSDRPFDGFHAPHRGPAVNGDAMVWYPDFLDWARNRRVQDLDDVLQEGPGLRSISWQGPLTRKRLLRSLDRLT
jgi:hypothetical protein